MRIAALEQIFHKAMEIANEAERAEYVRRTCAGDLALQQQVETLLAANARAATAETTQQESASTSAEMTLAEGPGTVIGRYKLLQKIGEGGMGAVYMAEQEEPVRRRVALKIIKLGMDTRQVVARFEAERQALALMDHPNIAKVLDGGSTETGRPYFVMELVRGVPLTEYCDRNRLSTKERLQLFISVCHAIQHAHQKGIIHRDIKPSNVLVTLNDGVAQPMVIDFGIAKATGQRLTEKTVFTNFATIIGTPAYMSPEQAEMSKLDVDTRSDIYSLGVLLYELLTGTTPFVSKELLSAGYGEMQRIILEVEPPRPSVRLSTMNAGERTAVAKTRSTEPGALGRMFRDLDWVVMKCIEKDRGRRYQTPNALAADIRRHLDNEPIVARPPSAGYRLQKAVRRNRAAFAGAGAVVLALVIGVVLSERQALRARKAEADADRRRQEAESISHYLVEIFRSTEPERDGRKVTVVETLDRASKRIENDLKDQPNLKAGVQATLGETYAALGLEERGANLLRQALNYYRSAEGPEGTNTLKTMHNLVNCLTRPEEQSEALALEEQVLAITTRLHGATNRYTIGALESVADLYARGGREDDALKTCERAFELCRQVFGLESSDTLGAMSNLALCHVRAGRWKDASKLQEQALAIQRKLTGPEHPDGFRLMNNLALTYRALNRQADAIKLQEQSVRIGTNVFTLQHPQVREAFFNLIQSYLDTEQKENAYKAAQSFVESFPQLTEAEQRMVLRPFIDYMSWNGKAGRGDEAIKVLNEILPMAAMFKGADEESLAWLRNIEQTARRSGFPAKGLIPIQNKLLSVTTRLRGAEDSDTLKTVQLLAASYGMSDQADESIRLFETLLDRTKSARGSDAPETLSVMHDLAVSYGKKQRWNEAIALQEQVVAISRRKNGPEHDQTLSELGILAVMYGQSGRLAKVIELTSERLSALRKVNGNDHPETLETIKFLASALWEAGQLKEALALNEEALKSIERTAPAPEVAAILSNIGFLLDATSRGEEAIASWQKAVALDPKLANTQYWLGRALLDRKRFAEAVRPLRAARQFYPNGPRAQDVAERLARAEAGAATKKEGL